MNIKGVTPTDNRNSIHNNTYNDYTYNDYTYNDHAYNDHAYNDHAYNDHAYNDHAYHTITRECLEQRLRQNALTLLMTESQARFQFGHIPGSQCFSLKTLTDVPAKHPVVVYAVAHPSLVTYWAYQLLTERGFGVCLYVGGLRDWLEAGYPLAPSNPADEPVDTTTDTITDTTTDAPINTATATTTDTTADEPRKTPNKVTR